MAKYSKLIIAALVIYSALLTLKLGINPATAQAAFGGSGTVALPSGSVIDNRAPRAFFIHNNQVYYCTNTSCKVIHDL